MTVSFVKELCHNQAVFNGFRKHLAVKFLHEQRIWSGMPPSTLCASDACSARSGRGSLRMRSCSSGRRRSTDMTA